MNSESTVTHIKGRARLLVSDSLVQRIDPTIEKPKAGAVLWDGIEFEELVEKWRPLVLLPDGYAIIGVFFDVLFHQWILIVESDAIPLPEPGETLPLMSALYQTKDGMVSLTDLRLLKR